MLVDITMGAHVVSHPRLASRAGLLLLAFALLVIAGCSDDDEAWRRGLASSPPVAATSTATIKTPTHTPRITSTPTAAPTASPANSPIRTDTATLRPSPTPTATATETATATSEPTAPFEFDLPLGFPPPRVPEDNPMSDEKVELGRFLFYDTRLSGNQTQACASCHQQERAFTDGLDVAVGSTGELHPRNSMSLTNIAYAPTLTWANNLLSKLEAQALVPMFGEEPVELGLSGKEDELLARLRADERYQAMFPAAFPEESDPFSVANVVRAIASFQRTLISGRSAYDRWLYGEDSSALSDSAIRGLDLFRSERLECFHCHGGVNFTDSFIHAGTTQIETAFHNNGLYNIGGTGAYPPNNTGLLAITGNAGDMGRFKAPTLRNIELTAPYMHDGSIATLEGVLEHYAAGGRTIDSGPYAGVGSESPFKDPQGFIRGFQLTDQETQDVVNFLKSLTDYELVTNPRFSDPFR